MKNIISIHGVPRTGSSWLLSIFNSNNETKCIYQPLFSYSFKNILNETSSNIDFDNFINNIKETDDSFCNMKTNFHTNNGINKILDFDKTNIKTIVMKHVTHHYLIEKMIEWNPNIKIIGLIRNPTQIIESQMNACHENLKDWLNGEDKNNDLKENYFGFNKLMELNNYFIYLKEKYEKNVYLIRYEDLLKNTLEEIRKLFIFCNIKLENSTIEHINISTSIHDKYDYSIFRNKELLINKKNNLNQEIQDYINNKYPRIAIIICINEINKFRGTTSNRIKGSLSYVNQFLMLYYSIKENWFFNYKIYLIHSRDFSKKTYEILNNLDIVLKKINTDNLLIRPESYLLDIECDYRLVLDADMIALKNPTFNFDYEAQAQYGDFNYESLPNNIFDVLKINKPNESNFKIYEKINIPNHKRKLWSKTNFNLIEEYYKNELNYEKKYYPIFNHGAILIKNKYSKILGEKLILYKTYFNTTSGQDVVGFIINDITKGRWTHFNKGFNFTLNQRRISYNKKKYIDTNNKIELLHYIFVNKESIYFKKYIEKYYNYLEI